MKNSLILAGLLLTLMACDSGGDGSTAASADVPRLACSLDPRLDVTVEQAVYTIQHRLTVDLWTEMPPAGGKSAQRTITHELVHFLTGRRDHVATPGNLMHAQHDPRQRVFGPDDDAYLGDAGHVAYTEDLIACDVTVAFGEVTTLGCPAIATGCQRDDEILLNPAYRWHVVR